MKGIFDMGFNLEEMAGQFGLDAETIKKAAESGDLSSAMDSISGVLADKGIDMDAVKNMLPDMSNIDMNAVKDMMKDIDFKNMSPDMLKDLAEKFMGGSK